MFKLILTSFAGLIAMVVAEDAPWSHAELHFGNHDALQGELRDFMATQP